METVVAPNIDVVRKGVLIGSITKVSSKLSGVSAIRNLTRSLALLTTYDVPLSPGVNPLEGFHLVKLRKVGT